MDITLIAAILISAHLLDRTIAGIKAVLAAYDSTFVTVGTIATLTITNLLAAIVPTWTISNATGIAFDAENTIYVYTLVLISYEAFMWFWKRCHKKEGKL